MTWAFAEAAVPATAETERADLPGQTVQKFSLITMDESQDVPELPTKKARHDPEVGQESDSRGVVANDSPNRSESAEVNPYPPSSVTHLHTMPGGPDQSDQETISRATENVYTHNVTCKDLTTTTATDYTSQIYQGSNTAVTAYAGQVAFPSLGQSSMYSAFPQSGQTYGLPPFGLCFTLLPSVH